MNTNSCARLRSQLKKASHWLSHMDGRSLRRQLLCVTASTTCFTRSSVQYVAATRTSTWRLVASPAVALVLAPRLPAKSWQLPPWKLPVTVKGSVGGRGSNVYSSGCSEGTGTSRCLESDDKSQVQKVFTFKFAKNYLVQRVSTAEILARPHTLHKVLSGGVCLWSAMETLVAVQQSWNPHSGSNSHIGYLI